MSAGVKGRIITESQKANMALAQTGRKHPESVKAKIAAAHKGKSHSEEHKRNNGRAHQHFDKWPHPGGRRCTCRECKDKKNAYNNANYQRWKKVNE